MDKETVHTYTTEYYTTLKKKKTLVIFNNIDGIQGHYNEWNQNGIE